MKYIFTSLILGSMVFGATLSAMPTQKEFRNDQNRMSALPTTSDANLVNTGQYRFALGSRTIWEVSKIIKKINDDPKYIPDDKELGYLKIATVVAAKIMNNRSAGSQGAVFGDPSTLDDTNPTQAKLKESLNKNSNLRFLKENPNVTYDMQLETIAGWAPQGINTLKVADIIEVSNKVDALLPKQ